jgi:hypothetical protein
MLQPVTTGGRAVIFKFDISGKNHSANRMLVAGKKHG